MSRIWDPESISEIDKRSLDRMIEEYNETNMSLEKFFFDYYLLDEFLKREIVYMAINGNIPFQEKYFKEDDQDFEAARDEVEKSLGKTTTLQRGARKGEDAGPIVGNELAVAEKP